ncbi:hypothetical protein, conserved [Trypanosoma brucei brucei TREU927]|uniref:Uncharacterized protein n=1 Tax=Trypanosoma brucei brucei (strain 927/4 GUTat10.1) TaxID=185431 RepID=Q57WW8_TRYB2|nr:hypothetical protein, conserved [Trypanosoma brucei brucei TREU927]AAX69899.1 hypothetical protein, conserved [Trypanosoma brucei]AAZ10122.1 hypothetical protein, conserved [Trypanosoma brucei brucei TREU927]
MTLASEASLSGILKSEWDGLPCSGICKQRSVKDHCEAKFSRYSLSSISRRGGADFETSSVDSTDSGSFGESDVSPLRASQFRGRDNRGIGYIPERIYSATIGEEEEEETSSYYSSDNSADFQPLHFSLVVRTGRAVSAQPEAVVYHTDEDGDSYEGTSVSDDYFNISICRGRAHPAQGCFQEKVYEAVESGERIPGTTPPEDPLQTTCIKKLIKRLRDPDVEVTPEEFEDVDWDNPSFKEQLYHLKQVAAYIEAREMKLKTAGNDEMEALECIDKQIKEAVNKIPEITISNAVSKHDGDAGTVVRKHCVMRGITIPIAVNEWIGGTCTVVSKPAGDLFCREGCPGDVKESVLTMPQIRMVESRTKVLPSENRSYASVMVTTLAESPRHIRRKRVNKNHVSQLVDVIFDDFAGEIVEEETSEMRRHRSGGVALNEHPNQPAEKCSRKKRRKHPPNRNISLLDDVVASELDSLSLSVIRHESCDKKTLYPSKRRRAHKVNERSITFSDLEVNEGCEIPETAEDIKIIPSLGTRNATKTPRKDRQGQSRRSKKGVSRSSFSLLEVPGEFAGEIEKRDIVYKVYPTRTTPCKGHGDASKDSVYVGVLGGSMEIGDKYYSTSLNHSAVASSEKKRRRHRPDGLRMSRQLKYSFVPDEAMIEIFELDSESGLVGEDATPSAKGGVIYEGSASSGRRLMNRSGSLVLPEISSTGRSKHCVEPRRVLNRSINLTRLPEVVGSELPDTVVDGVDTTKSVGERA